MQFFLVTHTWKSEHDGEMYIPLGYAVVCASSESEAQDLAETELYVNRKTDLLKIEPLGFPVSAGVVAHWEVL